MKPNMIYGLECQVPIMVECEGNGTLFRNDYLKYFLAHLPNQRRLFMIEQDVLVWVSGPR